MAALAPGISQFIVLYLITISWACDLSYCVNGTIRHFKIQRSEEFVLPAGGDFGSPCLLGCQDHRYLYHRRKLIKLIVFMQVVLHRYERPELLNQSLEFTCYQSNWGNWFFPAINSKHLQIIIKISESLKTSEFFLYISSVCSLDTVR